MPTKIPRQDRPVEGVGFGVDAAAAAADDDDDDDDDGNDTNGSAGDQVDPFSKSTATYGCDLN